MPPTPFTLITGNAVGTSDVRARRPTGPYSFTTPQPPPGRFLFSIALCNDLHMGETDGRADRQHPAVHRHPAGARAAALPGGHARVPRRTTPSALGADFLLAAGDITAEAVPVDLSRAGQLLTRFGAYRSDYFVTRGQPRPGAHRRRLRQRAGSGSGRATTASTTTSSPATSRPTSRRDLQGLRVIGIDTYDKPGNGGDAGALSPDQFAWFRVAARRRDRDQPTMVFGHHPLIVEDSPFPISAEQLARRRRRPRPSSATTRDARACSCTTPGTRTATSARSARSRPT